ncbi:DUF2817 domain-containing protein [Brucella intermedia]|uniref:DUF2817 domain-containing protein n=1 Tax=Brucella intermedia TaxID=94625 RepID=UPI00224911D6|nr:DUF2817 domain-containing protein [Brucella intermedia]
MKNPDNSILFSQNYFEARERFLSATKAVSYPSSAKCPKGRDLFTDVTWIGDDDAKNVLVLIAGTHGVEAYCGSAAQLSMLYSDIPSNLLKSTAIMMIHALNPYGFAWDRRVTPEGCDLNRNFIDFSQPVPENPGYDLLADCLVPRDLSEAGIAKAEEAIGEFRTKNGEMAFQSARKCGQYTRPDGMFYGGAAPSEARQTLERVVDDFHIADRENVVIIDYHTGLGPYGYGELQCETSSGIDGYQRAREIFGHSVTSPDIGTSTSFLLTGTQDDYWEGLMGDKHTYVCLEFGTFSQEESRKVLRNDHWLFAYRPEQADELLGRNIRAATKNQYNPNMRDWQEMVVFRCDQVHRQAVEWLNTR